MERLQARLPFGNTLPWSGEQRKAFATVLAVTGGTFFAVKFLRGWRYKRELTRRRQEKQGAREKTLDELSKHLIQIGISDDLKDEICSLSMEALAQKLQNGELKAVDVLHAYQKKALEVNGRTNCLVDIVREAEAWAVECDQMQGKSDRLLHGIPVSLKDNFIMAGYDSVIGSSCNINRPFREDCVIVKVLKHQGAVPFVRTNVPQTMLSYDTCNPVFGQTYNPHGTGRCAGGSSGGEGALVAGGGSVLGLGSDIGGSIRIPSSMCGICGFKPTACRWSSRGMNAVYKGQNLVVASLGPMARDVDSLALMMRAILCQYHFDLDKTLPPLPFNEKTFKEATKLRIGFYLEDGLMISSPPMQRAVKEAVSVLQKQGHTVVPWNFPDMGKLGMHYWPKACFADKGVEVLSLLKGDAIDHSFGMGKMLLTMNKILFNFIVFVLKLLYPRMAISIPNIRGVNSVSEWQKVVTEVVTLRQAVESDLRDKGIEVVIAPAFTMPAPPVGAHQHCPGAASYTTVYNVLNFPAGTLPVTKVNEKDIADMENYPTPDLWHRAVKKSMVGAEGLPVGVQVVGLPWRDETCLRIMKELETGLKQ